MNKYMCKHEIEDLEALIQSQIDKIAHVVKNFIDLWDKHDEKIWIGRLEDAVNEVFDEHGKNGKLF